MNAEAPYPHFFHILPPHSVTQIVVEGDIIVSFLGIGDKELKPAPPVSFNLTFACPEGQIFDHDWFASPSVMTTCQVGYNLGFHPLLFLYLSGERSF